MQRPSMGFQFSDINKYMEQLNSWVANLPEFQKYGLIAIVLGVILIIISYFV